MNTSSGLIFDAITFPHTRKPLTSAPLFLKACQVSGVKRSRYAAIFSSGSEGEAIIAGSPFTQLKLLGLVRTMPLVNEDYPSCPVLANWSYDRRDHKVYGAVRRDQLLRGNFNRFVKRNPGLCSLDVGVNQEDGLLGIIL